jgi:mannose-6-phosphate isomerase-like protein (cupin superfamily)
MRQCRKSAAKQRGSAMRLLAAYRLNGADRCDCTGFAALIFKVSRAEICCAPANGGDSMIRILDLKAEFGKLTMLQCRTPAMTPEQRVGAFANPAPYRDGGIFMAKFAGNGAWERHPQGEEIVQIVEGTTTLHIIEADERYSLELKAGMMAIVPINTWHRFEAPDGVCLLTATPQPTQHLDVDVEDPRTVA